MKQIAINVITNTNELNQILKDGFTGFNSDAQKENGTLSFIVGKAVNMSTAIILDHAILTDWYGERYPDSGLSERLAFADKYFKEVNETLHKNQVLAAATWPHRYA